MDNERMIRFTMGGMAFEYDEQKNRINLQKHGISFKSAARVFFDYDRIEFFDDEHSNDENRYDTIGDTSAGMVGHEIGSSTPSESIQMPTEKKPMSPV